MAYLNNIPMATDQLNDSQPQIQNNFLEIYDWVAVNHEQFDTANAGKHTEVTLPINTTPTATGLNEANMYSRTSANTNNVELTWQRALNQPVAGPGKITEMTASRVEPLTPFDGWSMLPSGLLIKWGRAQLPTFNTDYVIAYPLNVNGVVAPIFGAVFTVYLTTIVSAFNQVASIQSASLPFNNNNFTARGDTLNILGMAPVNFMYLAVGVPV